MKIALVSAAFVIVFLMAIAAHAQPRITCTPDEIRRYEMILGMTKGRLKPIPQLGFTIEYLGTVPSRNGACAILVRRAD